MESCMCENDVNLDSMAKNDLKKDTGMSDADIWGSMFPVKGIRWIESLWWKFVLNEARSCRALYIKGKTLDFALSELILS